MIKKYIYNIKNKLRLSFDFFKFFFFVKVYNFFLYLSSWNIIELFVEVLIGFKVGNLN